MRFFNYMYRIGTSDENEIDFQFMIAYSYNKKWKSWDHKWPNWHDPVNFFKTENCWGCLKDKLFTKWIPANFMPEIVKSLTTLSSPKNDFCVGINKISIFWSRFTYARTSYPFLLVQTIKASSDDSSCIKVF